MKLGYSITVNCNESVNERDVKHAIRLLKECKDVDVPEGATYGLTFPANNSERVSFGNNGNMPGTAFSFVGWIRPHATQYNNSGHRAILTKEVWSGTGWGELGGTFCLLQVVEL